MKNTGSSNQVFLIQETCLGRLLQPPGSLLTSGKTSTGSRCATAYLLEPNTFLNLLALQRAHCNLMQFVSALKNNSVRHQGKWCTIQQQSSVICRLCDWKWGGEQFPKECILLSRCIRIKGKMVARETGHSCQLCRRRIVKCLQGALYSHKRRQEHSQARDPDVALGAGHPFQGLASAFRQTERVWHICSLQKGNTHEKQRKGCHKIMIWHCTWQRR